LYARPNGISFVATPATTTLTGKWQLKPGDIVSFKHKGFWLGSGKPKSPTIYRLRLDKTWDEVVASFKEQKHTDTGTIIFLKDCIYIHPSLHIRTSNSQREKNVQYQTEHGLLGQA
jgi:hypothetical protein